MKFIKILLFGLLVLVLAFIVLHFMGPKTYDLNRSVTIDADQEVVWNRVNTLADMNSWSPWVEMDPAAVHTINGTDGEVGSYSHWDGPESGVGEQRIEAVEVNKSIETDLEFIEPDYMAGTAEADIVLSAATDGKTTVTWSMKGENKFPMRSFALIPGMTMDDQVGPMYEKGLAKLKTLAEGDMATRAEAKTAVAGSAYAVTEVQRSAQTYVVKREKISMENLPDFMATNIPAIITAVAVSGQEMNGTPSALYYDWDEATGTTDVAIAIPVKGDLVKIQGYDTVTLPKGASVFLSHKGDYESSGLAHMAIEKYMTAEQKKMAGPALEEYVVGPNENADPSKWVTNIYYSVE